LDAGLFVAPVLEERPEERGAERRDGEVFVAIGLTV
jgi:hypothetical protein